MMTNWDVAEQALKTSQESAGSAMSEHEKWMQSLEAKINQLKAAWQGLSQAFMSSDFLKGLLDGVINLVQALETLIDTFGTLPTLLGAFGMGKAMFGKNGGFFSFDKDTKQFQIFGKSLDQVKGKFSGLSKVTATYRAEAARVSTAQSLYGKNVAESGLYMANFGSKMKATGKAAAGVGKEFAKTTAKTLGAKAATVGLSVASTALSSVMSMGIGMAISLVIAGITKLINAKKELSQHVDEVTSKYKEQHEELMKNKADFDSSSETSAVSRYAELSKGVNSLGENVSLTSSEYEEYLEVTNKIAASVPSLVAGYDAQGNAILNTKGNVEELVAAYEKLIQQQNNEILDKESGDIEKDFKNKIADFKTDRPFEEGLTTDVAKGLEEMLSKGYNEEQIGKYLNDNFASTLGNVRSQIREALEDAGVDVGLNPDKALAETIATNPEKIRGIVNNFKADFDEAAEDMKTIAEAALSNAFDISSSDYAGISDEMQSIIRSVVNSFDGEFYAGLSEKGISIESYITDMLDEFKSIDENGQSKKLEAVFNLKTQFDNGDISYGEYINQIKQAESLIDSLNLDEELKTQIKLSLNTDDVTNEYDNLINRLTETNEDKITNGNIIGLSEKAAKTLLNGLSSEELSVAMDVITDPNFKVDENATDKKIQQAIQSAIDREIVIQGLNFDLDIETESAGIDAVNTALQESVSATGLSSESISALKSRYVELESQGYNLSQMFEETSNGIRLNRQAFSEMEQAYASQKLDETNASLAEMKSEYDKLGQDMQNCSDIADRSALFNKRQTLAQKISEAATLAAQYEGLASSYKAWQDAEAAGSERDMYEGVIKGFETIKDEISRGWIDDGSIKFLELLTGRTDLATTSTKELKKVYDSLDDTIKNTTYSVKDFFTVDAEGNSTNQGVYNFLDAVGQLEEEKFGGKDVVKRDKNGNIISFDFEVAGGDKAIADALGISEELVQIMVRAADDAGFVVNIDGAYTQLADLQNEAMAANDKLKELGKTDITFDFNTTDIKEVNDQLYEAKEILKDKKFWNTDGTFNFDAKGATEAMTIVSTLQAKLDNLEGERKYGIGLTVEDENFQESLEKLQEYGTNVARLNQLELNPKANTEEIETINKDLNETAKYFAELDGDTKVELGFKADDGIKEVKEKIENGEVEIPTTLDVQAKMSKNLEDLVMLGKRQAGLITKDELDAYFEVDVDGEVNTETLQDKLDKSLNDIKGLKGDKKKTVIDLSVDYTEGDVSFKTLASEISSIEDKKVRMSVYTELINNGAFGDGDTLFREINEIKDKKVRVKVAADLAESGAFNEVLSTLEEGDKKVVIKALTEGTGDVDNLNNIIDNLPKEIQPEIGVLIDDALDNVDYIDGKLKYVDETKAEPEIKINTRSFSKELKEIDGLTDEEREIVIDAAVKYNKDGGINNLMSEIDKLENEDVKIQVFAELIRDGGLDEIFGDLGDVEREVIITALTEGTGDVEELNTIIDKLPKETQSEIYTLIDNAMDNVMIVDGKLQEVDGETAVAEALVKIFGAKDVDDLQKKLSGLTDAEVKAMATVLGKVDVEQLKTAMGMLDDKQIKAIAQAIGKGDVEGLKKEVNGLTDKQAKAVAQAFGFEDVKSLKSAVDSLNPKTVQAIANALGITDVKSLKSAVDSLDPKTVEAIANAIGRDKVVSLKSAIDSVKGKTVTVWAQIKKSASSLWNTLTGGSPANGTANASGAWFADGSAYADGTVGKSGRAFKQGDWGVKGSGVALGGELGQELVVRNGRFFTIGDKGAEFFRYKPNDIIFNAGQTKQLFEQGKITNGKTRGRAIANGTAFVDGFAFPDSSGGSSGTGGIGAVGSGSGSGTGSGTGTGTGKGGKNGGSTDNKDFKETFDWIEIAISRIERAISRLDTRVNRTYKSWSYRNKYLKQEISKVSSEISLQEKAYKKYIEKANSVGLSAKWKKRVREGKVNISTIKDEKLAEKIKEYQEWYEKALACKDALLELQDTEMELYKTSFDNIVQKYDDWLSMIEYRKSLLEEYISQSEEKGYITSSKYYNSLINQETNNINKLKAENAELIKARDAWVKNGGTKYSQDWYEMTQQINDNNLAIAQGETNLIKYNNALRDIDWQVFDLMQERISNISEEADFLIDLMSNDKLYDDNGQLTNEGMATMGLHGQNYNTYMAQADEYAAEINRLNGEIAKDPYNQDLINRRNELIKSQRDSIKAAEDEKQAIKDMVQEGINVELDALQERIDKYNESLDAAKDLYDYQKKVKQQTKEIADIEKQLAAYQGDTSEEAKQKVQELKVSLKDAKDELKETEYDKYISDQEKLLDDLYSEYEEILNQRLDNVDALVEDMIEEINNNAGVIKTTIEDKSDSVGYTISEEMKSIWNTGSGNIKSVLTTYGDNFSSKLTTVNNTLSEIKLDIQKMVLELNKEASNKISGGGSKKPTTTPTKTPTTTPAKTPTTTPAKTIKVGGKIKATGAKIYGYKGDKTGATQYYKKDPIYKVLAISGDWIKARYHKLTKGVTGWFKKKDVKAYKTGTKAIKEQMMAWTQENGGREFIVRKSDGAILTPLAKNDSVLSANASNNIWDMANDPSKFIKNNLDLNVGSVPNNINVENSYVQNLDKVVFSFPNVQSYDEMLSAMQRDKSFEKLITAMTIDRIAGKSSLAKNKAIR